MEKTDSGGRQHVKRLMDEPYECRGLHFEQITEKALWQNTAKFRPKRTFSTDSLGG